MNISTTCERIYIWSWILRYIIYSECFMISRNLWYMLAYSIILHFTLAIILPFNFNFCLPYAINEYGLDLTAQFMGLYWMLYASLWVLLWNRVLLANRVPFGFTLTGFFWKKAISSRQTAQLFINNYHSHRREEIFQALKKHSNLPHNINLLIHDMVFLNTCDCFFTEKVSIVKEILYCVLNAALVLFVSLWLSCFGNMIDKYCFGKLLFPPVHDPESIFVEGIF